MNKNKNREPHIDFVGDRREAPETGILKCDYLSMCLILDWLRETAPKYAAGKLLDYGCSNKPYFSFFEGKVNSYVGVDIVQNKFNTVDFVLRTGDPLPFEDNSIDTVLSTQVLEHVADPDMYIRETARVLKPGCNFILTCPSSYMVHEEPYDYYRYTEYGLRHLLDKNGLKIIKKDQAGGAWRLAGQILMNHFAFGGKKRIPIISSIFYYSAVLTGNLFFSFMDHWNTNEKDTINLMIIAQKQG